MAWHLYFCLALRYTSVVPYIRSAGAKERLQALIDELERSADAFSLAAWLLNQTLEQAEAVKEAFDEHLAALEAAAYWHGQLDTQSQAVIRQLHEESAEYADFLYDLEFRLCTPSAAQELGRAGIGRLAFGLTKMAYETELRTAALPERVKHGLPGFREDRLPH